MSTRQQHNQCMDKSKNANPYHIYPAYTFAAAPTFQKWVHLTAADVQGLRQEPAFQGQNIYFHLNHPVEYVYVVGPIVAIDHIITQYNTRFTILEIDDGSGATIEAKVSYKAVSDESVNASKTAKVIRGDQEHAHPLNRHNISGGNSDSQDSEDGEERHKPDNWSRKQEQRDSHPLLKTHIFQTTVENLTVISGPGGTDLFLRDTGHGRSKQARIDIGTIVKAKGTLQRWRGAYQLVLRRAFHVTSLDEEVQAWLDYSDFAIKVLSKPWVLSEQQIKDMEQKQLLEREEQRHRQTRREQRDKARKFKCLAREKKRERFEQKVAERLAAQAKAEDLDGDPLDHPGWKPTAVPTLTASLPQPIVEDARPPAPSTTLPPTSQREFPRWQHDHIPWQHEIVPLTANPKWQADAV